MARPIKRGIDYFPFDVSFFEDIKIRKISHACGIASNSILICLLCNIYRENGYYVDVDEDMTFLVADTVGTSEGAVTEVINKALQVDFFDTNMYERYKILTSKGIQERYKLATYQRKNIKIDDRYLVIHAINQVINTNNSINCNESTQSKVNKSKEDISLSKGCNRIVELNEREKDRILDIFFFKNYANPESELERYIANYSSQGWSKSGGQVITDKVELAKLWRGEKDSRFPVNFLNALKMIYVSLDEDARPFVKQINAVTISDTKILITCTKELQDLLENASAVIGPILRKSFPTQKIFYKNYEKI